MSAPCLGYGTASLLHGPTRREAVRLIHCALDEGITHIDTAPSYGLGEVEHVVGEALAGRRQDVFLVGKVGLAPLGYAAALSPVRRALKPVLGFSRTIRRALRFGARAMLTRRGFALPAAGRSLEASLEALRTTWLDALLLHQVTTPDLSDELLEWLGGLKAAGVVREVGLATSPEEAVAALTRAPDLFTVVQIPRILPDRFVSPPFPLRSRRVILHSVLKHARSELPGVELAEAARYTPADVVLFGTRSEAHIRQNARQFEAAARGAAPRFLRAVGGEP